MLQSDSTTATAATTAAASGDEQRRGVLDSIFPVSLSVGVAAVAAVAARHRWGENGQLRIIAIKELYDQIFTV